MSAAPWHRVLDPRFWLDSPLPIAAVALVGCALVGTVRVAHTLARAETVRGAVMAELARLAADAAALEVGVDVDAERTVAIGEFVVDVRVVGEAVSCEVRGADRIGERFVGTRLPGAMPDALRQRLAAADPDLPNRFGEGAAYPREALPRLDAVAVGAAERAERRLAFRRDPGVALLRWDGGTERDDYVADRFGEPGWRVPADGIVVVPGHLWVPANRGPVRWHFDRDITVVVEGNLYVGAGVEVVGAGRLTLVTQVPVGSAAFADLDGNGRWSPGDVLRGATAFGGPLEGGGSLYLGVPGGRREVDVDAILVVGGEVHVAARATLSGSLAAEYGITELSGGELRFGACARLDVHRENLPGLLPVGSPRVGLLRRVAPAADELGGVRELPLYLGAPGR